jgi:hypothetical protein
MSKYNSYEFRTNKKYRESLTKKERSLMIALIAFGETIDPNGYDDGDYDSAIEMIMESK